MIEYEDFSLKIEPKRGEIYPVIVLQSPAGEGRSSFTLPFDLDEIGDILFDLGWTVRGTGHMPLRDVSQAATRTRPQQIGDQLFSALFSGTVRSLLDHSLGMIYGRQRGLRIKLHIDPEDSSLAQLASLPWEFMYRKEKREFLNLSRFTPIIRYLDVQSPYSPLSLEPPLRILVVISDPADYDRLDLERERELIETSWAQYEGVHVEFMEQATILALQDRMADQPYHVLHYMGHGGFDKQSGRGVLVMEDEDGQGAIVDGNTLGILLRDLPTMRLAFLNACETARVTKEKGLDPFAGVAAAMVMAGIPAVVAMQFPVSDRAAITFSQKFYPLLARGEPVDAAVAEGRRAIRLVDSGTMEWGTPVLFLRAPQGVIFQVSETQREKVPLPEIPELPEELDIELEKRLADIYTQGLSAFWLENWEKAARSFQTIVDVRPDYEDAADKLAEAERQANLQALYTQAQEAQNAGDWVLALAALEHLATEAPDYKGTSERLQIVRKQKRLTDLYSEAKTLNQAQEWLAVVNVFAQIHAIEPEYLDREGLLGEAEQQVAAQKRQEELKHLYSLAVREMDSRRWQEAHQILSQLQEMEPGFQETDQLLARVELEIEREEKERKLQEQITTLYEQGLGLAQAQQWRQVLAKVEEIQNLDPEFTDPEGLAAIARNELNKEEQEARRQSELAALYAEAVRLLETGQYKQALRKWDEVQAQDPRYPDRKKVQATAKRGLTEGGKRRLPGWVWALSGAGVIIILTVGILVATGVVQLPGQQAVALPQTGGSTTQPTAIPTLGSLQATVPTTQPTTQPTTIPTLDVSPTIKPTEPGIDQVGYFKEVFFDFDHRSNGLSLDHGGDVDTEVVTSGDAQEKVFRTGNGQTLLSPDGNDDQDFYMQFQVEDDIIFWGLPTSHVQIEVEYLDEGTDNLSIQYDASSGGPFGDGRFKDSEEVTKTGSGEFRTVVFTLDDAIFANRDNGGDFRIDDRGDGAETIRSVTVTLLPVYDEFDAQTPTNYFDSDKWYSNFDSDCIMYQYDGNLVSEAYPLSSSGYSSCVLVVNGNVLGKDLLLFEADVKVDEITDEGWWALVLNPGKGYIECGIGVGSGYRNARFDVMDSDGNPEYEQIIDDIGPYQWNTLLLEIDPEAMRFSCYFNDQQIGSYIPNLSESFKDMPFNRYLQHIFPAGKMSKIYADNIRIAP